MKSKKQQITHKENNMAYRIKGRGFMPDTLNVFGAQGYQLWTRGTRKAYKPHKCVICKRNIRK